ncbi:MAG: HAMP domain-containing protein [Candidatus Riflebacteria bacterium]|nr:HAMP domain-containing protein [Candidatus Riflebacteria bacterium]
MKVQAKLFLAMMPTAIVLVFIGFFASSAISQLSLHSQTILKDNFLSVLAVQRMMEASERMDSAALLRLTGKASESVVLIEKFQKIFEVQLRTEENNITEAGELEAAKRLRKTWMQYQENFSFFLTFDADKGLAEYHEKLYPLFLEIKECSEHILNLNQDAMVQKSERVQELGRQMNHFTFAVIIFASGAGIFLSIFLGRQILRPLSVLSQTAQRIATGDLGARAIVLGTDEIAQLSQEFNLMADQLFQLQKSSLGELLLAQQGSQAAIDSLPDPVVILDLEGNPLNINYAAESELKITLKHKDLKKDPSIHPELRNAIERVGKHILGGKGPYFPKNFEEAIQIHTPEGEKFYLPRGNPLKEDNQIIGATIILQEISRLRRFDQLKSDLVSTVSHEFKTPLTSLRMAIHLLLEHSVGDLTGKQEELLYASREDCERLQTLVDDLLDLSKIQEGKIQMVLQPCSAESFIETVIAAQRMVAEENGIELETLMAPEKIQVMADPERIQIVLKNLIANAIRHSPPKSKIQVRLSRHGQKAKIEVSDTGPGISPEYQKKVFEKFFRIPGTPGTGSGLGLFISGEIIEKHGGEIGLESSPGQGSIFWFTVPIADRKNILK